jgi:beta-lactamase regulating signal transducer with metallopeptidase domain
MILIDKILPDSIIYSLGWTIIHSLWQGALIALLLFSFFTLVKSSSTLKAKVSVIAFGLMVVSFIITFSIEFATYNGETTVSVLQSEVIRTEPAEGGQILPVNTSGEQNLPVFEQAVQIKNILVENISLLAMFWFAGLIIFTFQLFGGLYLTRKLKFNGTSFVPAEWQNKVNSFRYKLKISKPVRMLESNKITIPIVIGYLKPVILLPVGMLTGLPASQLEAIIIHELAHIYRNDYLINILQSAGEIILFYHPAAWWISHKIRIERENSCDDIAVSICGDKLVFAKALAHLEEVKMRNRKFALAVKNSRSVLGRVKRLFNTGQKELTLFEKSISMILVITLIMSATVFASVSFHSGQKPIKKNQAAIIQDSTWKRGSFQFNNNKMNVKMNKGKKGELFINGKRIPANEFAKYKKVVEQTLDTLNINVPEPLPLPEFAGIPGPPPAAPLPEKAPMKFRDVLPPSPPLIPEKDILPDLPPVPPKVPEEIREPGFPVIEPDSTDLMRIKEEKRHLQKLQGEMDKERERMKEMKDRMKVREMALRKKTRELKERSMQLKRKNEHFIESLTMELVKNGIIKEGEKFSMKFSNNELIINGEMQSDEMLRTAKNLYKKAWGNNMKDNSTFEINH